MCRTLRRAEQAITTTPNESQVGAPRILFVITSFDRGRRLVRQIGPNNIDKLDYVLMIMDEVREACEVGEG